MASIRSIRRALRDEFGDRNYKITREGEIHAYGTMPNTNIDGRFLYGRIDDEETMFSLGLID